MLAFMMHYLPSAPHELNIGQDQETEDNVNCISTPQTVHIEPIGSGFLGHLRRYKHGRSLSSDLAIEAALADSANQDSDALDDDEEESQALLMSDPLQWKNQDHYAILGLSRRRWRASDEDVKRAYRRKVLKHHPDKKTGATKKGKKVDDSFFKCIQKAWEILGDPVKRRHFDSVDPTFDDSIPTFKRKPTEAEFFEAFDEAFEMNARFSTKTPVPKLGDMSATREEVDKFYNFWVHFTSWRSFEYLDEEDTEKSESREEKRYLDRQNKAMRVKRKNEDNRRISNLVEQAMKYDPRLSKFKEEDKAAKEARKRERQEAERAREEEEQRKRDAEQREKERIEMEERERAQEEKAKNKKMKDIIRKEKRNIKKMMEENNYFLGDASPAFSEVDAMVAKLEAVFDSMNEIEEYQSFSKELSDAATQADKLSVLNTKHSKAVELKRQAALSSAAAADASSTSIKRVPWSPKEVQILIKAVKMFPGGTQQRWEKIAEYVTLHGGPEQESEEDRAKRERKADECIRMAKDVQRGGAVEKMLASQPQIKKSNIEIKEAPSQRYEGDFSPLSPASQNTTSGSGSTEWTSAQQSALEAALKKYPAAAFKENPGERWGKVASEVEGKTVKQVKLRVKELAEMVKRKKAGA